MEDGKRAAGDLLFSTSSFTDVDNPRFREVLAGGPRGASIFENMRALPRPWLTHKVEVQTELTERLGRPADPTFDLAGSSMLSAPLPPQLTLPTDTTLSRSDHVTVVSYEPESVRISTQSALAGVLVLSDQQFPGWEATVDGRTEPISTVDDALRGVYLPAGSHTVVFSYRPVTLRAGAAVSAGASLLLLLLCFMRPSSVVRPMRQGRS